jgi:hypothetical protein
MNKLIKIAMAAGALYLGAGCAAVVSANGPNTSMVGDAWYTTTVGLPNLPFSTHIYYCPKPAGPGPVQCKEATYVEAGK